MINHMIQDRICRTCGRSFKGGPRAFYCPDCRLERKREVDRKFKQQGAKRPLGSKDICERCGKPYTVTSGLQRYCPNCQRPHALEHDRQTGIKYYHDNSDHINPSRNAKRHIGLKRCVICGKEFDAHRTRRNTCSDACADIQRKQWQQAADKKRSPRKKN